MCGFYVQVFCFKSSSRYICFWKREHRLLFGLLRVGGIGWQQVEATLFDRLCRFHLSSTYLRLQPKSFPKASRRWILPFYKMIIRNCKLTHIAVWHQGVYVMPAAIAIDGLHSFFDSFLIYSKARSIQSMSPALIPNPTTFRVNNHR